MSDKPIHQDLSAQVLDRMFRQDGFSQWMGMEILEISEGHCVLRMTVRKEMLNGFDVAHGGLPIHLQTVPLPLPATATTT